jgi:hypothetical protein
MKGLKSISRTALLLNLFVAIVLANPGCEVDDTDPDDNHDDPVENQYSFPIVDTGLDKFYDDRQTMDEPAEGEAFYGQDAQYKGNQPSYVDNGDATITDQVTGLMWQQSPDTNGDGEITAEDKMTYEEALEGASEYSLGGYDDWRLPSIKELYSLILFSGVDPSGYEGNDTEGLLPFINTEYFEFAYGDTDAGERIIDAQFASSTKYVDDAENLLFGVNFADGRIKGYGLIHPQIGEKTFFVLYVRGNNYGENHFVDNGDGTVSDEATGLMWMQADSGEGMKWQDALAYADTQRYANYDDWRLPNAKELQSILDYTRSPGSSNSAAIDPIFTCTPITNEAGQEDYAAYWSSTTHENWSQINGGNAAYVSFGRAMGYMMNQWRDVHGAGAQRSDPKVGDPAEYPYGHGPQGDAIRILNFVRLVRDID